MYPVEGFSFCLLHGWGLICVVISRSYLWFSLGEEKTMFEPVSMDYYVVDVISRKCAILDMVQT